MKQQAHYRVTIEARHKKTSQLYVMTFVSFADEPAQAIERVADFYDIGGMDVLSVKTERCHPSAYFIGMKAV